MIGAGLAGAAAAWALSRRGYQVTVIEQAAPAWAGGSSHGSARIVRRAYLDPFYVGLTGRAFDLWRELELSTPSTLLRITGGIDHGPGRDPARLVDVLASAGVTASLLPAAEASERWPGMRFDGPVVHHDQAGTVDASAAVGAFLAGLPMQHATVSSIVPGDDHVDLVVDGEPRRVRRVVVAAGAWAGALLGGVVPLPALRVTRQRIFHFPRRDPDTVWPVTIHKTIGHKAPGTEIYHLPGGRDGGPGDARKVAEHDRGIPTAPPSPGAAIAEVDDETRARVTRYVEQWLPGLDPRPFAPATCLYTSTPDDDFVLDRVGGLVVVSACSGHGGKFAPLLGELAADLVDGGEPLPRFRLPRAPAAVGA